MVVMIVVVKHCGCHISIIETHFFSFDLQSSRTTKPMLKGRAGGKIGASMSTYSMFQNVQRVLLPAQLGVQAWLERERVPWAWRVVSE